MAFLALAMVAGAQSAVISAGPAGPWVIPVSFERLTRMADLKSGDTRLLLRDVQINARTHETFHHEARQLLTMP
jgi:hypothetical protein